jgi:hypothetical protein
MLSAAGPEYYDLLEFDPIGEPPCTSQEPVTISPDLQIHIPEATYQTLLGDIKLWVDFKYVPNEEGRLLFEVTDYGAIE